MDREDRRAEFVTAAFELFEKNGIAKTSVGDIAKRVGVTRSLFYHYFPDKTAITKAVIEYRIDEFVSDLQKRTVSSAGEDIYTLFLGVAKIIRSHLQGSNTLSSFVLREGDAMLFQQFAVGSSQRLAELFQNSGRKPGSLMSYTNVRHPYESLYTLSLGIISLVIRQPEVTDETIVDLAIDTLGIELEGEDDPQTRER